MQQKSTEGKKILVTGATGQIGDFLLPQLLAAGHRVYAFTRSPDLSHSPAVTWFEKDIFDTHYPDVAFDTIIHLAYLPHLPVVLAHLMQPASVERVIGIGSTSRFTKAESPNSKEQSTVAQLESSELSIAAWCEERGVDWTLFRPTLIYGRGLDKNVTTIMRFIKRFHLFPIVGGGGGLRQPVHARDLANAVMLALGNPASFNKSYNLSGGETLTYREMVRRIFKAMQKRPLLVPIPLPVLKLGLSILRRFPGYRHINLEMATRMLDDLYFSHEDATKDFGYKPGPFVPEAKWVQP